VVGGCEEEAKVAPPSFDVLLIALHLLQRPQWLKSANFVLLSFTFDYTLGVPITVLYHPISQSVDS
jgi:hypothetical protein